MKKKSTKSKKVYLCIEDQGYGKSNISIFRENDDEPISSFVISNARSVSDMLNLTKTITTHFEKLEAADKKVEFGNF